MSTLAQLRDLRTASGARYLAAVLELKAATVELAALDRTLMNDRVAGGTVPTFGPFVDVVTLRHPQFAPSAVDGSWADDISAAMNARLAAFPTPDSEE